MITEIDGFLVDQSDSLKNVIGIIDKNACQVSIVVDSLRRLQGLITDGDIRRSILRGASLDSKAIEIMNPAPLVSRSSSTEAQLQTLMVESDLRQIPVVDDDGIVIGLATLGPTTKPGISTTPVVLMAGGKGQRLFPMTKDVPKPMLPVGGTPIIGLILERIRGQGFRDVRISVNYLAESIEAYVGDGSRFGLEVSYIHEQKPLGTAGALGSLQGSMYEPFIVMNADLLTSVNLTELVNFHSSRGVIATLGVREHVVEIPFGVVSVDEVFVTELREKPLHRSLVSAGIYCLEPESLEHLTPDDYCDMPNLLTLLISSGESVAAFPIHEDWLDVGRPEDLNLARTQAELPG